MAASGEFHQFRSSYLGFSRYQTACFSCPSDGHAEAVPRHSTLPPHAGMQALVSHDPPGSSDVHHFQMLALSAPAFLPS